MDSERNTSAADVAWVTDDLVDETIKSWQPLTKEQLSLDEARSILVSVGQLFDAVGISSPVQGEADT
jgi:hypothetical protein